MKRLGAALVLVAGLTALVLALSRGDADSAQAAVQRSAEATAEMGSWRYEETAASAPDEAVESAPTRGVIDYVHHRGRVSYLGGELLYVGRDIYIPNTTRLPGASEPWLRFDASANDSDPFDLAERAVENPARLLEFLTGASDDVRDAGAEDVRGTATRHYEGTLELQQVIAQASPERRAGLQATLDFLSDKIPTTVPFGLWVDDDGVARRLRVDGEGQTTVTLEFFDFGVPVEVDAPPPNQVMELDEWMAAVQKVARTCYDSFGSPMTSPDSESGGAIVTLDFEPSGADGGETAGESGSVDDEVPVLTTDTWIQSDNWIQYAGDDVTGGTASGRGFGVGCLDPAAGEAAVALTP